MSFNSVQTNTGAMIALQSLNRTNSDMAKTQKAISTGFRVSDAKDDGAAFVVAQRIRSDVAGLTSVNQELKNTQELVGTTLSSLGKMSDTLVEMRKTITTLASDSVTGTDRQNHVDKLKSNLKSLKDFLGDAEHNGKILIGNHDPAGTAPSNYGDVSTVRNEKGSTVTVTAQNLYTELTGISFTGTDATVYTAANMQKVLDAGSADATYGGVLSKLETAMGKAQNAFSTSSKYIGDQINYNSSKMDALNSGIGAMVDADLTKEAANLQALQVRQQLGTQALSIANQAPQSLLSLFR